MITSTTSFYSNGKLLLTGEYMVMFGAKALALPVKYGQSIKITEHSGSHRLVWVASELGQEWFRAAFSVKTLDIESTTDVIVANRLQTLLRETKSLSPQFISESSGYSIETNLNFNRQWGLGTSSTLLNNLCRWATVDPFELHWKVSKGSGYDIACAESSSAIVYQVLDQLPLSNPITFHPAYQEHIYFIYLGQKQDSAGSIEPFHGKTTFSNEVERISGLTQRFIDAASVEEVVSVVREHEILIGEIVKSTPVQDRLFSDFSGAVKSLGAWGGDFVMAITPMDRSWTERYFQSKGYGVVIPFDEIIIADRRNC